MFYRLGSRTSNFLDGRQSLSIGEKRRGRLRRWRRRGDNLHCSGDVQVWTTILIIAVILLYIYLYSSRTLIPPSFPNQFPKPLNAKPQVLETIPYSLASATSPPPFPVDGFNRSIGAVPVTENIDCVADQRLHPVSSLIIGRVMEEDKRCHLLLPLPGDVVGTLCGRVPLQNEDDDYCIVKIHWRGNGIEGGLTV